MSQDTGISATMTLMPAWITTQKSGRDQTGPHGHFVFQCDHNETDFVSGPGQDGDARKKYWQSLKGDGSAEWASIRRDAAFMTYRDQPHFNEKMKSVAGIKEMTQAFIDTIKSRLGVCLNNSVGWSEHSGPSTDIEYKVVYPDTDPVIDTA